ncbi:ABC transporter substrate-binding protein [bacterium]|nr:ABC transporter substrate-binding protein [bacterium]
MFGSKRLLTICSTVLLAAAVLTGCERKEAGAGAATGAAADSGTGPIKVGVAASLSGSEATWGRSTQVGAEMAAEEVNSHGGINGRKIELVVYDDKGQSQEMGLVVTRMIKSDKVVAILGEVASGLTMAGARIAQPEGIPMVSHAATNPDVTAIGDKIFRVCFTDDFQGFVTAKFASENLKAKKAAILYDQAQAYSVGLKDTFKDSFTKMGGTIASEQAYTGGDQDFSAQLNNIKSSGAEVLFIPGYYTEVGNIALQADRLGMKIPMLGGDGWDSPQLAKIAGKAIEGHYYANHVSPEAPDPALQKFVAAYKAREGQTPDAIGVLAYDAAHVLFAAMGKAKSLSGDDIAKELAATKDFPGASGMITLDEKRNATKPAVILQMKDGKPTYFATITPN